MPLIRNDGNLSSCFVCLVNQKLSSRDDVQSLSCSILFSHNLATCHKQSIVWYHVDKGSLFDAVPFDKLRVCDLATVVR